MTAVMERRVSVLFNCGPFLPVTDYLRQRAVYHRDPVHCPSCGALVSESNPIINPGFGFMRCGKCPS